MVRAEVDGICRERGSPCDRGEKVAGPPDPQTTRGTRARQSWQQRRYPSHVVPHLPLLWLLPIPMRDLMPSHEGGARLSIEIERFSSLAEPTLSLKSRSFSSIAAKRTAVRGAESRRAARERSTEVT